MVRVLVAVCLLALSSTVAAQGSPPNLNTSRLGLLREHNAYNDIWGYAAPDGREYACVGLTDGFIIVNCTDPVNPYEVAYFPGSLCVWRDLKTFNEYLYVVNDCTAGIEVVDLSDPENPVMVNTFATGQVDNAHNVAIDTDTGILYAVGTGNGMQVYDLNVNPIQPPRIEVWGPNYVHDISVQDGIAHAALIFSDEYRTLNVNNPSNIFTMGIVDSNSNLAHSTWPSEDNTLVVKANEKGGLRHLSFYDTSNPFNPVKLSQHTENTLSIPHNPFLLGDYCHVAWYTEGYVVLDVSDPSNPVKVGRWDTQPDIDPTGANGFSGAWGCYPFSPSGFVYVSDRQRGLSIVTFNECSTELAPAPNPQVCKVWPESVSALESPRQRVVLTGSNFDSATSVNVGGTIVTDFVAKNDQVIHFRMPLVSALGTNAISVTGPGGTSGSMSIEVEAATPLVLDTGEPTVQDGDAFVVAFSANPGDQFYPVVSLSNAPSVLPEVSFDIGNGFSELTWLPAKVANAAGVNGFPVVVPASAVGLTIYWQVAVVDPNVGLPAASTNFTVTSVLP